MTQHKREMSMSRFRTGKADVLVATDVAARGIDVPQVALVVNYDIPNQELIYFHRIGRTARAGGTGRAITLVSYSSIGYFNIIKRQIKTEMVDLNKEMNIKIKIPDPLKRQIPTRRYGAFSKGPRKQTGHSSGRRDARDERRERQGRKKRFRGQRRSHYGLRSRW